MYAVIYQKIVNIDSPSYKFPDVQSGSKVYLCLTRDAAYKYMQKRFIRRIEYLSTHNCVDHFCKCNIHSAKCFDEYAIIQCNCKYRDIERNIYYVESFKIIRPLEILENLSIKNS